MDLTTFCLAISNNVDKISDVNKAYDFAINEIEHYRNTDFDEYDSEEDEEPDFCESLHEILEYNISDNISFRPSFSALFLTIAYLKYKEDWVSKSNEIRENINSYSCYNNIGQCSYCAVCDAILDGIKFIPRIIENDFEYYKDITKCYPYIYRFNAHPEFIKLISPFMIVKNGYKQELTNKVKNNKLEFSAFDSYNEIRITDIEDNSGWHINLLSLGSNFCTEELKEDKFLDAVNDITSVHEVTELFNGFRFKCLQITDNVSNEMAIALINLGCLKLTINQKRILDPDFLDVFIQYNGGVRKIIVLDENSVSVDMTENADLEPIIHLLHDNYSTENIRVGEGIYCRGFAKNARFID